VLGVGMMPINQETVVVSNIINLFSGEPDRNEEGGRLILNNLIEGKDLIEIEGHVTAERAVFMMQMAIKQILESDDE